MGLQGLNSSQAASDAELCSQVSQAQPMNSQGGQGSGDGANDSPYNMANANDPYGCQANPNGPGCARAENPMMDQRGDSGFGGPSEGSLNPNDFNIGDASVDPGSDSMFGGNNDSPISAGPEAKYKTVPNNSGGSIPGGGGSSEAKLDPKARSTASSGPSVNTNIEQGFRSGGGGGYAGGAGSRNGASSGEDGDDGIGYNPAAANGDDGSGLRGLDLKRFLPGGSSDPGRFLGGNALSSQIHGPSVDLWGRISNRLQQRCRLGLLFGCY